MGPDDRMAKPALSLLCAAALWGSGAAAGEADVRDAQIRPGSDGSFVISATLLHADTGWDHYADRWEVTDLQGKVLGTRVLWHPHVDEQPFTRSLSGVVIPPGVRQVRIRARDSVHGHGGQELTLDVPH